MKEEKEINESKMNSIVGGQTNNTETPSLNNRSKEEDLGGKIHINPTDEHIIPPFNEGK